MFLHLSRVLLGMMGVLSASAAGMGGGGGSDCRDKTDMCLKRVKVNVSSLVLGLIDDPPREVFETFVAASSQCLHCVDQPALRLLAAGDPGCQHWKCKGCEQDTEKWWNCRSCCDVCRCMGCDYNYGPGNGRVCDDCCPSRRRLGLEAANVEEVVKYAIDVCMDDISPLDTSSTSYIDYELMLNDFYEELKACYDDEETFFFFFFSLSADVGIDLSLMARDAPSGGSGKLMFGEFFMDTTGAQVVEYDSSESHRSTSHMLFYSALGFVAIAAFAILATAVVVKVMNKRRVEKEEQAAKWISELSSVETSGPLSS